MNALRLNDGFMLDLFESRTGLSADTLTAALASLEARELLEIEAGRIRTTALGRRFLDTVIAEFLPG